MLGPGSDYVDLGVILPQACTQLIGSHGIGATDCEQVQKVVLATEMHLRPTNPLSLGANLTAPVCDSGRADDAVRRRHGEPRQWEVGVRARHAAAGRAAQVELLRRFVAERLQVAARPRRGREGGQRRTHHDADRRLRGNLPALRPLLLVRVRRLHEPGHVLRRRRRRVQHQRCSRTVARRCGAAGHGQRLHRNGVRGSRRRRRRRAARSRSGRRSRGPALVTSRPGSTCRRSAGSAVLLRFRTATDFGGSSDGWFVDDVSVYRCGAPGRRSSRRHRRRRAARPSWTPRSPRSSHPDLRACWTHVSARARMRCATSARSRSAVTTSSRSR